MARGKKKPKHGRVKENDKKPRSSSRRRASKSPKAPTADPIGAVAAVAVTDVTVDTVPAGSEPRTLKADPTRRGPLTEMVPVRFDAQMLADVRARAAADHRSVSSWIRLAVDLELHRGS